MSTCGDKKFRMNEGDWICNDPQCGNVNFARRSTCNRCGKAIAGSGSPISEHHIEEKSSSLPQRKQLGHEIGKAAAEKSRGLFSADDWQCGRCGNVNWARRQQCNMCNAPKYGEVEERTGLGGGYNERENIEYIEREESDGEYDDFGRKKKKFRGALDSTSDSNHATEQKTSKLEKEPIIKPEVEIDVPVAAAAVADEEDDEDEEEDGEDLSKYDFSDWGDASPKKQTNDKNSHSHSSSSESHSSSSSNSSSSSRSHSRGSQSSSPQRSSSATPMPKRHKRTNSRSRSSSYDSRSRHHHRRSRSSSHSPVYRSRSRSRDRERSQSKSPKCRKR